MAIFKLNAVNFVIDANVFIKLLVDEYDSDIAEHFFIQNNSNGCNFIVPSLFIYEVVNIAIKARVDINTILSLLDTYQSINLFVIEPTLDDWQLANKICQDGNDKSGYPSMYDSIYQAMAINRNIQFITADSRHFAKANKHGNIALLENWQLLFNEKLN